jgi:hypothetical protein
VSVFYNAVCCTVRYICSAEYKDIKLEDCMITLEYSLLATDFFRCILSHLLSRKIVLINSVVSVEVEYVIKQ